MAHELEIINGVASYAEFGNTTGRIDAWHALGQVIATEVKSVKEALPLIGADYITEVVRSNLVGRTNDDGTPMLSEMSAAVMRRDRNIEFAGVSPNYVPIQNAEQMAVLDPYIAEGLITLECGGVLRNGATAWLCGRVNLSALGTMAEAEYSEHGVLPYVTVNANHSATACNSIINSQIKQVCANTMQMTEFALDSGKAKGARIDHKGDVTAKIAAAAEATLGQIRKNFAMMAIKDKLARAVRLTDDEFMTLVCDEIAPDPRKSPKFNPAAKMAELVVTRRDDKVAELNRLWRGGAVGTDGEPTAYNAIMAATELLDHSTLFPKRDGAMGRAMSVLTGSYRTMKENVLDNIIDFAESNPSATAVLDGIVAQYGDTMADGVSIENLIAQTYRVQDGQARF